MRRIEELFAAYLLPAGDGELQDRFYEGLCLVGGVTATFAVIASAFQDLPALVGLSAGGFALLCFTLNRAARRGHRYPSVFFVAVLALLNCNWFPEGASSGSNSYYFIAVIMYAVLFFRGIRRWTACAAVLANFLGLLLIEQYGAGLTRPFANDTDRLVDLALGFVLSSSAVVVIQWVVVTGYRQDRERLTNVLRELSDTKDLFSRMFELNPDALYVMDPERRVFLDVNENFTRMAGWTHEEALGRTGPDLNLWVDQRDRSRLYERLAADGRVDGLIARIRRRDGTEFWGSTSAVSLEPGSRLLLTTRDVTPLVDAQRAVAESRTLLSTLIDSTDDMVWLVEPVHYGLIVFNAAFAEAMRRTLGREPRPGMRPEEIVSPEQIDGWRGYYHRALESGPFTLETMIPGTSRVVLHSFNPVRHGGAVIGVSVFTRDITDRKRAEEDRAQAEMQLLQAQKMDSLGSLAGGVAHDFNNMLAGIMGYADLLLSDETDSVRAGHLRAILSAAGRSSELTRKLLAFGRRGKNIAEAVDLNAVVRDTLTMLKPTLGPQVHLTKRLDATSPIDGDPSQLNQLVVNLCINANEAMPQGGTLTIRTSDIHLDQTVVPSVDMPEGDYVELRVSDTGVGIPDEVKARIFEPFFTTKVDGKVQGTGLGLSTVDGIVHVHHGLITVESSPAHGTTFRVLLPKGRLKGPARTTAAETRPGRGLILVVEDEDLVRTFASAALAQLGYQAITAPDGREGARIFEARHAELAGVMLDLKMPHKNGRETFFEMQAIDSSVPVLICSGYGDNEEAQELISKGARGLLGKPFRIAELSALLARLT